MVVLATRILVLSLIAVDKLLVILPAHPNVIQVYMSCYPTDIPYYDNSNELWVLMENSFIGNRTTFVGDLSTLKENKTFIYVRYKLIYPNQQLYSEKFIHVMNQDKLREYFETSTVWLIVTAFFLVIMFVVATALYIKFREKISGVTYI